jgi:ubiquinone/menaquinone biosynthesis C-methylase UbiE
MEHHGEFWSKLAAGYESVIDRQLGGRTRRLLRDRIAREGALGRAVEFGCGTGFFTAALADKAERLLATDVSEGMLRVARRQVQAPNVTFGVEDCQRTSLPDASVDTAFMALVIQFTDPPVTLAEMHRILRPGGALIIGNLDPFALPPLARLRGLARVLYHGAVGYRLKPPKSFGRNVLTKDQLGDLLGAAGFRVDCTEAVHDRSRPSNLPVEYVRATRV